MDSFIDKFAQRKNAQEMIRANAAAEAEENHRLSEQIGEYEKMLQEIRKANYQNVENAEKVRDLLLASVQKIKDVQGAPAATPKAELDPALFQKLSEDVAAAMAAQKSEIEGLLAKQKEEMTELLEAQKKSLDELVKASDDFSHKESVKVYRNVQAVIEEELPKQTTQITEELSEQISDIKVGKGILPVCIITLILALANTAAWVLYYFKLI